MAEPHRGPSLALDTDFGPFHLERLVAVGGMAEIYLAHTKGLAGFEKRVALKVIHPDCATDERVVKMLVQEARLAVTLNHKNIVQTLDLGEIAGMYFITMEYVDGLDFYRLLTTLTDQGRELPIEAALYIGREIATGLEYAHTRCDERGQPLGIIHRDISPQNVLLSRAGEVKITDFGIAKAANVASQTRAGVIKGKLVYMSPEQSRGAHVDQRSDLFSAGIVLYEALTGGSIYLEQNPVKLLQMVRKAEIPPPSTLRVEIDPRLDAMLMKTLAVNPAARFPSAKRLAAELSTYLRERTAGFEPEDLAELVQSVADQSEAAEVRGARKSSEAHSVPSMKRKDFAVLSHSIIFSADEMMPSGGISVDDAKDIPSTGVPLAAHLLLIGDGPPKSYDIGAEFTIGRGGELQLNDGRVSRRHARIRREQGAFRIEDLNSSNGTFVNKKRVAKARDLKSGDTIHIGPYEMRFVLEEESDTARVSHKQSDELAAAQGHDEDVIPTPLLDSAADEHPTPDVRGKKKPFVEGGRPRDLVEPAPVGRAFVTIELAGQVMKLPVDGALTLDHHASVGELKLNGSASTIVRRADGYWLEPTVGRSAVRVNGRLVATATRLASDDELQVGPLQLRFQLRRPGLDEV